MYMVSLRNVFCSRLLHFRVMLEERILYQIVIPVNDNGKCLKFVDIF